MTECTLAIRQLGCSYQGQAILADLDLNVCDHEIVCLLGASGCGKTTLLKAMAGLIPLDEGAVAIKGCDMTQTPPEKRNIGMIFQDYALFPHLTVAGNIAFGLKGWTHDRREAKVTQMLELVRLEGLGERFPHQLSGGQQQRVAIARALASEPDLILLDEPFSNIDTQVRHSLIKEIRRIFKAQGVTAIFVTHSREEAFAFADKMAVMNEGVIEQYGTAEELYYRPRSRFVAEFLGAGSYLPVRVTGEGVMQTPLGNIAIDDRPLFVDDNGNAEWLLRPQNVQLQPDVNGEGVVTEAIFMGDSSRYQVEVFGFTITAVSNHQLEEGQKVRVVIEPHAPVLFAAA
ncbi:ABC transporter ATP-binding protein [Thaumasiovibrio subtropicus]|uniref:ABC transporter ATP-binding protein n=1 Tax=Thaumasiovibrio subtropicus TaxID=1891207 RepID=UPI000B3592A9|nr:ABC transporter ATP-binding protein [Thaumasiovibrio subtropicus]